MILIQNGFWFSWPSRSRGMACNKSRIDRALVDHSLEDLLLDLKYFLWLLEFLTIAPDLLLVYLIQLERNLSSFFTYWMSHATTSPDLLR